MRSVGVEEELLIVEPGTGRPRALAGAVIRAAGPGAAEPGAGGPRADGPSAGEPDAVQPLDRIQPWLATLLALSANSPFWQGVDSAYASFRYQAWGRWPCSGPAGQFGSAEAYQATVQQMTGTRTLLDAGMVYFDARLSRHYPTIEVRIADVCQHADDAVLIAALVRGLAETEARNWQAGRPARPVRTGQLRLAAWRASRSGLDDVLIDPVTFRPDKAAAVTGLLVEHVRDALADAGDTRLVTDLLDAVLYRGNGAAAQRSEYQRRGRLMDVITAAATTTTG